MDSNQWGHRKARYDDFSEEKFDQVRRVRPRKAAIRRVDKLLEQESRYQPLPTASLIHLADIALKARGQVGVVLGSIAKNLFSLAGSRDLRKLDKHHDLDVLILEKLSCQHPAPREWAIDWWVRPEQRWPTNGQVELWYDIEVSPQVEMVGARQQDLPLETRSLNEVIFHRDRLGGIANLTEEIRRQVDQTISLPAGLYLPPPNIMATIGDYASDRYVRCVRELREIVKIAERLSEHPTYAASQMFLKYQRDKKRPHTDPETLTLEICRPLFDLHLRFYELLHRSGVAPSAAVPHLMRENYQDGLQSACSSDKVFDYFANICEFFQKVIDNYRQIAPIIADDAPIDAKKYSYLGSEHRDLTRAALPVLPTQALIFTPQP